MLTQNQNNGYDTYDSAVVAAESEEAARSTNTIDGVTVKLLGEAKEGTEAGIILASL
jgi:hypothetical protein